MIISHQDILRPYTVSHTGNVVHLIEGFERPKRSVISNYLKSLVKQDKVVYVSEVFKALVLTLTQIGATIRIGYIVFSRGSNTITIGQLNSNESIMWEDSFLVDSVSLLEGDTPTIIIWYAGLVVERIMLEPAEKYTERFCLS